MDQTNAVARPDSACEAAFEEVRRLRLSGDFPEAVDRLRALAEQHITNPTVVAKCFELMHRCRAPEAALELIGRARGVGTEKRTRGLRIVEADCLRATGQLRDACALVSDIDPDGVKGHYRAILDRVTAIELEPLPEDVESIAQAFENGEPRTGAVAFHALPRPMPWRRGAAAAACDPRQGKPAIRGGLRRRRCGRRAGGLPDHRFHRDAARDHRRRSRGDLSLAAARPR
jgi:hypothetical protein